MFWTEKHYDPNIIGGQQWGQKFIATGKKILLDHDLKMGLYVIISIENHILAALEYVINDISQ